jgi:hypothetical protein
MLLPRFSIRTAIVMLTVGAVAFLIVGTAFRGQNWAYGAAIGIFSLAFALLVHAAWFGMVWLFSHLIPDQEKAKKRITE